MKNPAFDVTPARYIKGIITEKGIFEPDTIKQLASPHYSPSKETRLNTG